MTTRDKLDALCRLWQFIPQQDVYFIDSMVTRAVWLLTPAEVRRVDELWVKYGKEVKYGSL